MQETWLKSFNEDYGARTNFEHNVFITASVDVLDSCISFRNLDKSLELFLDYIHTDAGYAWVVEGVDRINVDKNGKPLMCKVSVTDLESAFEAIEKLIKDILKLPEVS